MPKTLKGQTAYGVYKKSGYKDVASFLKDNPSFVAQGGANDYMGLTGSIQEGQEYRNYEAPITPVKGTESYVPDLAKNIDINNGTPPQNNTTVQTSDSLRAEQRKKEIERIKSELGGGLMKPEQYSSLAEFDRLRKEQGIVNDEAELQALQKEALMGKQALREFSAIAGEGVSEAGRLGRMSEKERDLNFKLEGLSIRENAIINRINTKNSYINTVLQLGESDYNNAYKEYTDEYNRNSKAIDIYNQNLSDEQKDAMTGLTTITRLLSDKGVDLSTIDPTTQAQIDTLSMKAGLPQGLIQSVISIAPEDKVQTVSSRTDASGNSYWDVLKVRPDGSFYTQQVFRGDEGVDGATARISVDSANQNVSSALRTILGSGKFTKQQVQLISNSINNGEDPITVIKNQAKQLMTGANQTKVESYEIARNALTDINNNLNEFYAMGGSTGIFKGNFEKVINKLGSVTDPNLVDLATQIQTNLQVYRNAVSGTAYSVQEGVDIASIFPGINKSQGLNQAIISGRMKAFDSTINGAYKSVLGSSYDKLNTVEESPITPENEKTLDSIWNQTNDQPSPIDTTNLGTAGAGKLGPGGEAIKTGFKSFWGWLIGKK